MVSRGLRGDLDCPTLKTYLPHTTQVVSRGLSQVLVFEDDVRFESNFRMRLQRLMAEVQAEQLAWDLM